MRAITLPTAQAVALCQRIADAMGLPVAGVDVATDTPRTDGVGVTSLWVEPMPHPTDRTRAAVPVDAVVDAIIATARGEKQHGKGTRKPPAPRPRGKAFDPADRAAKAGNVDASLADAPAAVDLPAEWTPAPPM